MLFQQFGQKIFFSVQSSDMILIFCELFLYEFASDVWKFRFII